MSQAKKEVVQRIADAVARRDLTTFLELSDPDVEWHTSLSVISEGGAYHGHDGIRQYVKDNEEAFESFVVELSDVLVAGEVAIAVGTVQYRGKTSHLEQTESFGWVFRFEKDRVRYLRAFRNPGKALEAVGLAE
jgi:ketosteroid isomerase-like protein